MAKDIDNYVGIKKSARSADLFEIVADVCTDDPDSWVAGFYTLALATESSASAEVVSYRGPGVGWPQIRVTASFAVVARFASEHYSDTEISTWKAVDFTK